MVSSKRIFLLINQIAISSLERGIVNAFSCFGGMSENVHIDNVKNAMTEREVSPFGTCVSQILPPS